MNSISNLFSFIDLHTHTHTKSEKSSIHVKKNGESFFLLLLSEKKLKNDNGETRVKGERDNL